MAARLDVDGELVRRLAELLDANALTEIEYEAGGRRIRVARAPGPAPATAPAPAPAAPAADPAPGGAPPAPPGDGEAVTAPMVGTVYLSPQPGAPPFVKPGDAVAEGQTVALIEAMKTYNPVRAPRAGTVRRILVTDAEPVEFGQELVIVE